MAPRRDPAQPNSTAAMGLPAGATDGTAASGAAIGGTTGVTYPGIPTGQADDSLAQWLQGQIDAIDNALPGLDQDYDNAMIELDNAQGQMEAARASGDPLAVDQANKAVTAARGKAQLAQRKAEQARVAQNRYLTQANAVANRQAKVDARNDPQAHEERAQRMAATQAQIDANTAATKLANARLDKEFNPDTVAADNALKDAQAASDKANADYTAARAKAYPAESAAAVGANNASANASNAQAKQIQALIDAGMPAAQAREVIANATANEAQAAQIQALIAAGMPAAQAAAMVAQGNASTAATAVSAEDLHQKQIGELGTYAEQLQKQVDAGVLTRDQARAMLQAKSDELATGATAYTRQSQTAANSLAFAQEAQREGTLVNMGQQYATGGEPGGAYSQMSEALGFGPVSQPLHPTPLPNAIQALGADVNTPYTTAQLGMPQPNLPNPAPTSADSFTYSPAVQAPPPAVQGLGTAQVDWTALTGPQVLALARGGAPALPEAPPTARVPVTGGGGARMPQTAGRR